MKEILTHSTPLITTYGDFTGVDVVMTLVMKESGDAGGNVNGKW